MHDQNVQNERETFPNISEDDFEEASSGERRITLELPLTRPNPSSGKSLPYEPVSSEVGQNPDAESVPLSNENFISLEATTEKIEV